MSIVAKLEKEEWILYEILRHPVLFGEFLHNVDIIDTLDTPDEFRFDYYQNEFLCDFNQFVSFRAARSVGKTWAVSDQISWALVWHIFPLDYIVYHVPSKVHLEPVFTRLIFLFRNNSFLKNFIEPKGGINSSDYKITLLNGASLLCRIAGQSGTGANVVGLHSPYEFADESGYYPWGTWIELQSTLNVWEQGSRLAVCGVPTGLREKNVNFHVDMENSSYTKHRVSAFENPRFTEEDNKRALEQFGGEDSDDYIHLILGEHGKPLFSLFDRSLFEIETYPVYKLEVDGIRINELSEYLPKFNLLPPIPDKTSDCIIGIDLGYTEPTAIVILYLDYYRRLKFHARIKLTKVSYPIQEKLIDTLYAKFGPSLIGIDKGSAGIGVIQNLLEHKDYIHRDYHKIIFPIDYSSSLVLGVDSDGNEIKSKTKPYAVTVLQDYSNNHRLIYSSTDYEMITELERMTYSKNPTGEIVYKTLTMRGGKRGEDHFTSALLCATTAYYLSNEFVFGKKEKKGLMLPSWMM